MKHILPAVGRHGYPAARILAAAGERGHALYRAGSPDDARGDSGAQAGWFDGGASAHPRRTPIPLARQSTFASEGVKLTPT